MTLERDSLLHNRYRILEILGEGGMGAVYKASDENLGVTVAVKENLFTTDEYSRQFLIEATILASLRHPNLTRVTDHFEEGEGQYLVMDYVEGEDLRDRMDRLGILDEEEIIVIGAAICEALAYLHTRIPTILHRDIKPGNVKIAPDGQVFLVDFGLAKIVEGSQLTITGARAMTPGYSPPEQYGTARTDARSDVYSLGATLYSALTGSLPEDGLARAMKQVELTSVRKLNPNVSRKLAHAIEKALAIQAEDRFQTAEEFQKSLLSARSITRRRINQKGLMVSPPPSDNLDEETQREIPEQPTEIAPPSHEGVPTPSPQSRKVKTISPVSRPSLPVSRPVISPVPAPIFETSPGSRPKKKMGCLSILLLLVLLLGGGSAIAYLAFPEETKQALRYSVAPSFMAAPVTETHTSQTDDQLVDSLTGTPVPSPTAQLDEPTATPTILPTLTPTLTPSPTQTNTPTNTATPEPTPMGGSSQIAFASIHAEIPQIWIMNVDGTGLMQITNMEEGACQPDWSPDGTRLIFTSPCLDKQEEYPGSSLFIINVDGTGLTPLPTEPGGDYDPSWSPDGKQIAFTSMRETKAQIHILNLDDLSVQTLASEGFKNIHPSFSFMGDQIIFISARKGPFQVWFMGTDGSGQAAFSRSGELKNTYPVWTPDGQLVIFTQREVPLGVPNLVAVPVESEGLDEYYLVDDLIPRRSADVSPDGAWLLYESWPDGVNHDIYVMTIGGEEITQLTTDPAFDFDPVWRPVP